MCEHNSYDDPKHAIWKLSFRAVLVSIAFALMLLTGPFSGLLIAPRFSRFSSQTAPSQGNDSADPLATTGQAPSSSMVWVDTETGIYHKSSARASESGSAKLMTEGDAIRAGYRAATAEFHRRF